MMKLLFFFQNCFAIFGYPVQQQSSQTPPKAIHFMKRFGYLDSGPSDSEALFTETAVISALAKVQEFAGLRPTGIMDKKTAELLSSPRCGNPDFDSHLRAKRFVIGAKGWRKRQITYYVANWTPKLSNESFVKTELDRAFGVWSDYSRLKFKRINDHQKADIVIVFGRYHHGDNYPFDGVGMILAHAYYPYEFGSFGGDIHFDEDEDWRPDASTSNEGLDFFTVAVHEIGHALGLAHSPAYESVMFPYYRGLSKNFALGYDDILAMYQHYITHPPTEEDPFDEELDDSSDDLTTSTTASADTPPTTTTASTLSTTATTLYDDDTGSSNDTQTTARSSTTTTTTTTTTTAAAATTVAGSNVDDDYWNTQADDGDYYGDEERTGKEPEEDPEDEPGQNDTGEGGPETSTYTYEGDVEDVDDHIRKTKMRKIPDFAPTDTSGTGSKIPDLCEGDFDAIANIRKEIFIFKDKFLWRLSSRQSVLPGYPVKIDQMFPDIPKNLTKIDALYERPTDGKIVLFSGTRFLVHDGNRFEPENSGFLTDLGLPAGLEGLDAAFVWGKNEKIYFFRENLYWKFDPLERKLSDGYPQDISRWRGVPRNIDSVFTSIGDGFTYFFKGSQYWRFNDFQVKVDDDYPKQIGTHWIQC